MSSSKHFLFTLVFFVVFITVGILIMISKNGTNKIHEQEELIEIENQKINKLFEDLVMCESSNNELAINRRDSDGTASFGLLQWKPETFRRLAIKYGIIGEKADWNWIMTIMFDRRVNKKIFVEVMKDKTENPYSLWPICCRKLGCKRFDN